MITESNLRDLLTSLGFTKNGEIFEKSFPRFGVTLGADFNKRKLIYPGIINGGVETMITITTKISLCLNV